MSEYLYGAHYHIVADEEPLQLDEPTYVTQLETPERRFWMWRTRDQFGRTWNFIIGSGRSPFFGNDRFCDRWIYAEEADGENAEAFMRREAANHPA
jgi:hypothetical protein